MSTLVFLAILLAWRLRRWILLFLVVALLAGCGHAPVEAPRIELQARTYTEGQLTCSGEPKVPDRPRKPGDVARYVGDLHSAWQDCHGALGAVRERQQGEAP